MVVFPPGTDVPNNKNLNVTRIAATALLDLIEDAEGLVDGEGLRDDDLLVRAEEHIDAGCHLSHYLHPLRLIGETGAEAFLRHLAGSPGLWDSS